MPLCTAAEVKHAARVDADITEHDTTIPELIAAATEMIEQACNVPAGWFAALGTAARGYPAARRTCIVLCARWVDEPSLDPGPILSSAMLWPALWPGDMPELPTSTIPTSTIPAGAIGLAGAGAIGLAGAGVLVLA